MKPGAVEPQDLLHAQLWCRACEAFCFENDAESIGAFWREHSPHNVSDRKSPTGTAA